jgi:hypothetical protein
VSAHDRERDDGLASPARKVVDVERHPRRQEHQFRWQYWERLPRPEAEQSQPDAREDSGALDTAGAHDVLRCRPHVAGLCRFAAKTQGNVGLNGGRQVRRPTVEVRPGAVRSLLGPDPAQGSRHVAFLADAEKLTQEEILGVHRHVGFELAFPIAVSVLGGAQRRHAVGKAGRHPRAEARGLVGETPRRGRGRRRRRRGRGFRSRRGVALGLRSKANDSGGRAHRSRAVT